MCLWNLVEVPGSGLVLRIPIVPAVTWTDNVGGHNNLAALV